MNTGIYIYKETNLVDNILKLSKEYTEHMDKITMIFNIGCGVLALGFIVANVLAFLFSTQREGMYSGAGLNLFSITLVTLAFALIGMFIMDSKKTTATTDYIETVEESIANTKQETSEITDIKGSRLDKNYILRFSDDSESIITLDTDKYRKGDVLTFKVLPIGFTKESEVKDIVGYKKKAKAMYVEKGKKDNTLLVLVKSETKEQYKEGTKE